MQVKKLCTPVAYQTSKDPSLKLEANQAALDWAHGTAAETAQRLAQGSTAMHLSPTMCTFNTDITPPQTQSAQQGLQASVMPTLSQEENGNTGETCAFQGAGFAFLASPWRCIKLEAAARLPISSGFGLQTGVPNLKQKPRAQVTSTVSLNIGCVRAMLCCTLTDSSPTPWASRSAEGFVIQQKG
jgi:hypothetical protein